MTPEGIKRFAGEIEQTLLARFSGEQTAPALRMSNAGEPCGRKLWYRVNDADSGEPLSGKTINKFFFGDFLELWTLFLASEAGFRVEGRQDELELDGIKGHRDGVIEGVLVDVKSASSFGFEKFKQHRLEQDDPFGYRVQLGCYLAASQQDGLVKDKQRAAFVVINKVDGEICVDIHRPPMDTDIVAKRALLANPEAPSRAFSDVPDGASGNRKLGTNCSYCQFKDKCWPGLRKFAYSNGPRFLTKVIRVPDVAEIK